MNAPEESIREKITGLVLAGGQGSRLGGQDKGLVRLHDRPMIEHVLSVLSPQVGKVFINANRNIESYACYGYEVISDVHTGYQGPLAGIASGLHAATSEYLLCVPCDSPLLLPELVSRLYGACIESSSDIAIPSDGDRSHPVFALIKCELRDSLESFLAGGDRKILRWMSRHPMITVDFSDAADSFSNINTEHELDRATLVMKQREQDI